ncbi:MarR family transcriptional regulator [Marmoricola endophyticus]|uniref:MarR family transcriptional regulator n=1 Tax=Marmoricola endophyticus TaxID=2040280 RepID=A0A917BEK7_9ACTN|nr:MarR family transcriptional regulator [Marmoricola endophyticus]GGF40435.1 MarR family transcriptional regulator [Marmoricola endophyticus]
MGASEESVVRTARDLVTAYSRLRRRLKSLGESGGLTPSQTSVLSRLEKSGPAGTSELAAAERVRPQSMAATVAALEERGMVQRASDPGDGRRQVISVSDEGRTWLAETRAVREEWLVAALAQRLDADEQRTVREAAALVERVLDADAGPAR